MEGGQILDMFFVHVFVSRQRGLFEEREQKELMNKTEDGIRSL